jgi:hypothetical protein
VQACSLAFFEAYRYSNHHSALQGCCPADLHPGPSVSPQLPPGFKPPRRLPLTVGQVHFSAGSAQPTRSGCSTYTGRFRRHNPIKGCG